MRHAVLAGLIGTGCEVHDLGNAPTPTVGLAVRRLQAAGAIQISASHNPAPWKSAGMKLFGGDGQRGFPCRRPGGAIQDACTEKPDFEALLCPLGQARLGLQLSPSRTVASNAGRRTRRHLRHPRSRLPRAARQQRGRGRTARSRAARIARLPVDHSGRRSRWRLSPSARTPRRKPDDRADEGARGEGRYRFRARPGRADRLAILDEQGHYIGEELTLALAVLCRLRHDKGPVVINMSSSRVTEDLCQKAGVACHRSAVGEANVVALMRDVGALIGGEGNGGIIDPRVGWVRDPFLGIGLILELLARERRPLSAIVADLPRYAIVKDKYTVARERLPEVQTALEKRFADARPNRIDGLRLDWPDCWIHIRGSNTEPVVRSVIAEAAERRGRQGVMPRGWDAGREVIAKNEIRMTKE